MEQGLAHQMVYGKGGTQNTTHHYAGAARKAPKKKKCKQKPKK